MQSVGSTSLPPPSASKGKSLFLLTLIALIVAIISVFYFGSTDVHDGSKHLLYDAFDLSPPHAKLLQQLKKKQAEHPLGPQRRRPLPVRRAFRQPARTRWPHSLPRISGKRQLRGVPVGQKRPRAAGRMDGVVAGRRRLDSHILKWRPDP